MKKCVSENRLKILMIGPGRRVRGGVTTVVNSYYDLGLDKKINLEYISTMEDGSKIKKLFVAAKAYMKFCRVVSNFDIVHVHMAAQASFSRKSMFIKKAHRAGKKIVIHQHAGDFDIFFLKQTNVKTRKIIKNIFAMADKVIVLSEEWESFFAQNICDKSCIDIIHNGVVLPEYLKKDYSDANVLYLGRLSERKGTYDLLKAIPKVIKNIPNVKFYFGGDGDVEQCRKIAEEKGFSDHVEFLGWIRDDVKKEYLKKCSTFILPSYIEGMPMSVLEAMSYGLATISTNAGGIPQIIENGINGYRIEAGDILAMASVLTNVLTNVEQKTQIGRAGARKIKERFNALANVGYICELYHEILK